MNELYKTFALKRLNLAKETMRDADLLFVNGSYRGAANRIYYAVFHCMRAVLALEDVDFKKHSAVISYFRHNYIANGKLPIEFSDLIGITFDLRSDCDYDDNANPEKDDIADLLSRLGKVVEITEKYLKENM